MAKAESTRKAHRQSIKSHAMALGVHPAIIRGALIVSIWFIIAMAISFSGTIESDYLLTVIVGFSVIFFTLVLSLAGYAATRTRAGRRSETLAAFLNEDVAIDRGSISGREAAVQILMLPVTLAIGATIIGIIFSVGA